MKRRLPFLAATIMLGITALVSSQPSYAFDVKNFFSDIFGSKAGSKAVNKGDSKAEISLEEQKKITAEKFKLVSNCYNIIYGGTPEFLSKEVEKSIVGMCRSRYFLQYDMNRNIALSSAVRLKDEEVEKAQNPQDLVLTPDPDLTPALQVNIKKFEEKGYAPWPLVSVRDVFIDHVSFDDEKFLALNKLASTQALYVSNMVARVKQDFTPSVDIWQQIDHQARLWALKFKIIHIVSGPLFLNSNTSVAQSDLTVPTHFYKIIVNPSRKGSVAYIFPNKEIVTSTAQKIHNPAQAYYCSTGGQKQLCTPDNFVVKIKEIERLSGMNFFPQLTPYERSQIKQEPQEIKDNTNLRPPLFPSK